MAAWASAALAMATVAKPLERPERSTATWHLVTAPKSWNRVFRSSSVVAQANCTPHNTATVTFTSEPSKWRAYNTAQEKRRATYVADVEVAHVTVGRAGRSLSAATTTANNHTTTQHAQDKIVNCCKKTRKNLSQGQGTHRPTNKSRDQSNTKTSKQTKQSRTVSGRNRICKNREARATHHGHGLQ
jgi:hypothetical protein